MTEGELSTGIVDARERRIALCLSGGGLRATLYHLGVIRALRACKIDGDRAIDRIDHIYAVSGGSILAGHMLLKWKNYRDPDDTIFEKVANELISFARSNIRDRVLRRWFLQAAPRRIWQAWHRNPASVRTQLLQSSYERLFDGVNIDACYPPGFSVPRFHFLSTDFKTGELCAFSGVNLEIEDRKGQCTTTGCGNVKLAAAVAASSAFPPLFPPLLLPPDDLSYPPGIRFREALLLSDGGVYDNLGIEKLQKLFARDDSHPRIALISDAGAPFRVAARKSYSMIVGRNIRASDILMNRISDFTARSIDAMTKIDDVVIPITARVRNSPLSLPNQQLLRLVRTDLDIFDADIAEMLIDHGEAVTLASLRGHQRIDLPAGCELELVNGEADPTPGSRGQETPGTASPDKAASASRATDRLKTLADRASRRSFWSLAFDRQDFIVLLCCYAVLAVVIGGSGYGIARYLENQGSIQQQEKIDKQLETMGYRGRITTLQNQLNTRESQLAAARDAEARGDKARLRTILNMPPLDDTGIARLNPTLSSGDTKSNGSTATPSPDAPAATNAYDGRVYIQFAGDIKREEIIALNTRLRNVGWNVQGSSGERTGVAKGTYEVRYGGDNQAAALQLAAAIDESRIIKRQVRTHKLSIIGPTNLEVWISR